MTSFVVRDVFNRTRLESGLIRACLAHDSPIKRTATTGLPLLYHLIIGNPIMKDDELCHDGYMKFASPPPEFDWRRRLWATSSWTVEDPIALNEDFHCGKELSVEYFHDSARMTRLINKGHGKSSFWSTTELITRTGDKTLIREKRLLVYLPTKYNAESVVAMKTDRPFDFKSEWRVSHLALFNYSVLTHNAHRIHYDREYARQFEGYPDVLVHGSLLATKLLDTFLQNTDSRDVIGFEFKAMAPLFAEMPVTIKGNLGESKVWAESIEGGAILMEAKVNFSK